MLVASFVHPGHCVQQWSRADGPSSNNNTYRPALSAGQQKRQRADRLWNSRPFVEHFAARFCRIETSGGLLVNMANRSNKAGGEVIRIKQLSGLGKQKVVLKTKNLEHKYIQKVKLSL
jgi:hypothetical protein